METASLGLLHGDYTLFSGAERLRHLGQLPSGNDTLRGFVADGVSLIPENLVNDVMNSGWCFSIISVWRNILEEPVVTHPMALCDAQTVQAEELVVFEIHELIELAKTTSPNAV